MLYEIGANIKNLRESRGMTQKQLAMNIGVTEAVISNWETGKNRPNVDVLKKLCAALEVSADELLGTGTEFTGAISSNARSVAMSFDRAEEKRRRIIKEILEL